MKSIRGFEPYSTFDEAMAILAQIKIEIETCRKAGAKNRRSAARNKIDFDPESTAIGTL
jgi:hypothetical protein